MHFSHFIKQSAPTLQAAYVCRCTANTCTNLFCKRVKLCFLHKKLKFRFSQITLVNTTTPNANYMSVEDMSAASNALNCLCNVIKMESELWFSFSLVKGQEIVALVLVTNGSPSKGVFKNTLIIKRLTRGLPDIHRHLIRDLSWWSIFSTGLCADHEKSSCCR